MLANTGSPLLTWISNGGRTDFTGVQWGTCRDDHQVGRPDRVRHDVLLTAWQRCGLSLDLANVLVTLPAGTKTSNIWRTHYKPIPTNPCT